MEKDIICFKRSIKRYISSQAYSNANWRIREMYITDIAHECGIDKKSTIIKILKAL